MAEISFTKCASIGSAFELKYIAFENVTGICEVRFVLPAGISLHKSDGEIVKCNKNTLQIVHVEGKSHMLRFLKWKPAESDKDTSLYEVLGYATCRIIAGKLTVSLDVDFAPIALCEMDYANDALLESEVLTLINAR